MKKLALTAWTVLFCTALLQAQNLVHISGVVTYVSDGSPVPNHDIFCGTGDSISPGFVIGVTDQNGAYALDVPVAPGTALVYVSTLTFCDPSGGYATINVDVTSGQGTANFEVCNDSFPPFPDCFADFSFEPVDSFTFQFTSYYYALDSSQAETYLWDFGDGTTSTDANPVHAYANNGFYWVTLTITGENGCVAVVTYGFDTSFFGFPECMGYILYTQTGTTSFDFTAEIYNADGNLVQADSYLWDFGDGNTSTDPAPSHTYANEGVYTVQLHAITADGCEVHSCDVVFAYDCPIDTFWYGCQAMFYVNYGSLDSMPVGPPLDSLTLAFFDISLGAVQTWAWDFGDGSTSTEQNPVHTYATGGIYTVTLSITTIDGCESETSFEVCVGQDCWGDPGLDCQAMFIPLPDSLGGSGLQFIDLSITPGPIQSWSWNFGDGTTSNEQNPYHLYAQPGVYTVSLSIVAEDSCSSSISFEIDTENPWFFANDPARLGVQAGSVSTVDRVVFQGMKLFPNPAQDQLSIAFTMAKSADYEVRISDLTGRTLQQNAYAGNPGLNSARLDLSNLVPGLYLAEIRSGASLQTLKFVKQ